MKNDSLFDFAFEFVEAQEGGGAIVRHLVQPDVFTRWGVREAWTEDLASLSRSEAKRVLKERLWRYPGLDRLEHGARFLAKILDLQLLLNTERVFSFLHLFLGTSSISDLNEKFQMTNPDALPDFLEAFAFEVRSELPDKPAIEKRILRLPYQNIVDAPSQ